MPKSGGKLIATGSKSCVIKPNINCQGEKINRNNKKISKIVFGDKSKEYSIKEKAIDDIIKKIPGYKKWALIFETLCKPPTFDDSSKIETDIHECLGENTYEMHEGENEKKREIYDKNSVMLIGDYGGITLEQYFNQRMKDLDNIQEIEKNFLDIMGKMKYIFLGIYELNEYEISHLDIKPNNIVFHNGYFKFIDFGLSAKYDDIEHFRTRSYNESRTNRIYLWYPPEFLYSQCSKNELKNIKKELKSTEKFEDFRNHANVYKSIHEFFGRNPGTSFKNTLSYFIKNNPYNFDYVIRNVDVYSLGMLFPVLFYYANLLEKIKESEIIQRFFSFFGLMANTYSYCRMKIDEAYLLYTAMMKKYKNYKCSSKTPLLKSLQCRELPKKKPKKTKKKPKKKSKKQTKKK